MLNYNEAKKVVRELNLKTKEEYEKWWDDNKPANLPRDPDVYYRKDLDAEYQNEINQANEDQKRREAEMEEEWEELNRLSSEPFDKTKNCYVYRKKLVDKHLDEIKKMSKSEYEMVEERLVNNGIYYDRELMEKDACIYNVYRLINELPLDGTYATLAYYEILKDREELK